MSTEKKKTFIIIDSFALIYRAYYAYPPTLTTQDGEIINAVYGFTALLLDVLKKFEPTHVVAVFDPGTPIKRQNDFVLYKSNRKEMDQELAQQIPRVREVLDAFSIPVLRVDGYEADDVIGTLDKKYSGTWADTIIVSGDQDLFQLVDKDTRVYLAGRKFSDSKLFGAVEVKEKLAIRPDQVVDFKAISGDASDNIPGIHGIGKKGATDLLLEFDTLKNLYENIGAVPNRYVKKLQEGFEIALKSQQLATIDRNVPLTFDFEEAQFTTFDVQEAVQMMNVLRFRSLVKKVEDLGETYGAADNVGLFAQVEEQEESVEDLVIATLPQDLKELFLLATFDNLDRSPLHWKVKTARVMLEGKETIYRMKSEDIGTLLAKLARNGTKLVTVQSKELMHSISLHETTYSSKKESSSTKAGVERVFDLGFAGFLLGEGLAKTTLESICDLCNVNYSVHNYLANIKILPDLYQIIQDRFVSEASLKEIFRLETELLPLVIQMEQEGMTLDIAYLNDLENFLVETRDNIRDEIFKDVGHEFNINSPKQVGEILFEERSLPGSRKTKTGSHSTNERILSKLVDVDPVARNILRYREVEKLLSTYVKTLPTYVDDDGKIHALFDQFGAVSGRFASRNPNMQNIPLFNSFDINIRDAFVADEGCMLVAFDYSQQELRILAALANEKKLIDVFNSGGDIHALTASQLFNKPINGITKEERKIGKTINFSVIYGVSAFGLSESMNVDRDTAGEFIQAYFKTYPKIAAYFEEKKGAIAINKEATTLLGRKRKVQMLNSGNRFAQSAAERELINFRIQGTAADVMKIAMLKMGEIMKKYPAKLLLQVHDEFVFEYKLDISNSILDIGEGEYHMRDLISFDGGNFVKFINEVKNIMNTALEVGVKYDVDVKIGKRWGSMKEVDNTHE